MVSLVQSSCFEFCSGLFLFLNKLNDDDNDDELLRTNLYLRPILC